jgi:glutathione S-transferase
MKLYYMRGSCSLAAHIALREAGIPFELVRYDKDRAVLDDGGSFEPINDKGYVPVLELDDGQRLTEVAVVLQYIADRVPERELAPAAGTMARYRVMEFLNFTATEVHKIYWPLFHGGAEVENTSAREKLGRSFTWLERHLGEKPYLMGETFTIADAYLATTLNWAKPGGIDLAAWPHLRDLRVRVRERPFVVAALQAEGLLRPA